MHYFTRDFLELAAEHVRAEGVYHIARKKIPSKGGPVQVHSLPWSSMCIALYGQASLSCHSSGVVAIMDTRLNQAA